MMDMIFKIHDMRRSWNPHTVTRISWVPGSHGSGLFSMLASNGAMKVTWVCLGFPDTMVRGIQISESSRWVMPWVIPSPKLTFLAPENGWKMVGRRSFPFKNGPFFSGELLGLGRVPFE